MEGRVSVAGVAIKRTCFRQKQRPGVVFPSPGDTPNRRMPSGGPRARSAGTSPLGWTSYLPGTFQALRTPLFESSQAMWHQSPGVHWSYVHLIMSLFVNFWKENEWGGLLIGPPLVIMLPSSTGFKRLIPGP